MTDSHRGIYNKIVTSYNYTCNLYDVISLKSLLIESTLVIFFFKFQFYNILDWTFIFLLPPLRMPTGAMTLVLTLWFYVDSDTFYFC